MRTITLVCLFALLVGCSPKPQPAAQPATRITFEQIDTDKDGKVSLEEVLKASKNPDRVTVEQNFKARNVKGDGYLDRGQFDAWREVEFDGAF